MAPRYAMLPAGPRFALPGQPPEDLVVLRWDGQRDLPPGAERVRFWSPRLLVPGEVVDRALAGLPALEGVQLLSAGADTFLGRLPAHGTLCDARGVHGSSTSEWVLHNVVTGDY